MNVETLLGQISEALQLAEGAEECMQRDEHPSIADCGECYVLASGAADILEQLERDLRSWLLLTEQTPVSATPKNRSNVSEC